MQDDVLYRAASGQYSLSISDDEGVAVGQRSKKLNYNRYNNNQSNLITSYLIDMLDNVCSTHYFFYNYTSYNVHYSIIWFPKPLTMFSNMATTVQTVCFQMLH